MKQMVVQGDSPFLPEEIMRNILIRLPVKSLIRFQCVCKHWKNLIKTPSFVSDHLHYSSIQNPSLLLIQNGRCEPLHLSLIDSDMHVLEHQNPPLIGSLPYVRVVGSCNGLLCVASDEADVSTFSPFLCNSLLLWNPATREVREIPKTITIEFAEWDCTVGFGFSATVNDYKIVKTYAESGHVISGVEVYSLSTGVWKEIEFGILEGVGLFGDTVTANGFIYWSGVKRGVEEDGKGYIHVIVSFDLAIEVFTLITRPPLSDNSLSKFAVYEDKFALVSVCRIVEFPNDLHSLIDLWVLEEDIGPSTEGWSWTKKFSSDPCPSMSDLVTIWKNEIVCIDVVELLGLTNESGNIMENIGQKVGLCVINISTNELKNSFILRCDRLRDVFNHVESLVPVDNIRNEEP